MTAQRQLLEPDLSGETLDRYRLTRRLGVGGMGAVYEAEHTRLRKRFAVKLLRQELAQDETARKRFLREARAASSVTHPHVVGISDFGDTPDGHVFFVMELLEGRDLHELLHAEGRLPWPRAQQILLQVTSAIEAAHQQGIIHRDIKPSNCFLLKPLGKGYEDIVKVLDFGIAKLSSRLDEVTARLTSTAELFGTVAYMAPEMANGVNDDPRSDIYALGVMMYRMLVGQLPFPEGNAFQILSQHANVSPPPPRSKQPSLPEGVEAIILKALAKAPEDRFASMAEFEEALQRGGLEAGDGSVEAPTAVLVRPPKEELQAKPVPSEATESVRTSGALAEPSQVRRISPALVLVMLGIAGLAGTVAFFVGRMAEESTSEAAVGQSSASVSTTVPDPEHLARSSSEDASPREPVENSKVEPRDLEAKAVDGIDPPMAGAPPSPPSPSQTKVDPSTPPTPKPKPKPKPKPNPKPTPKPDSEVVNDLKAKLVRKCGQDGSITVKVEGTISASGKIGSPLITPETEPGGCVKEVVKEAKFESGTVRVLPRFSVKL